MPPTDTTSESALPAEKRTPTVAGVSHRWTRAAQRALIEAALKATPEASNRTIAADLGVDHKTVGGVRDDLESGGEIPHASTRTDTAGRQQPARKPKAPRPDPVEISKVLDARITEVERILAKVCAKIEIEPPPPTAGTDWLLVKTAADRIKYSNSGIYGLIRDKKVVSTRGEGGRRLVSSESLKSIPAKVCK
jgi:hypothetical protein